MFSLLKDVNRALRLAREIDADRFAHDPRYRGKISAVLRRELADTPKG